MEEQEGGRTPWFVIGCPLALVTLLVLVIVSLAIVVPILIGAAA